MLKKTILLASAAVGLVSMVACSDDESTSSSKQPEGSCTLTAVEDEGIEIKCGNDVYGIIEESSDGVYGASCAAEALKGEIGYKIVCAGDSVGTVYNGLNGRNGTPGSTGAAGTSCVAEASAEVDGYDVICGGEVIGYLYNGVKGVQGLKGEKGDKGDKGDTGAPGSSGSQGLPGESCSVTSTDTDVDGNTVVVITCGDVDKTVTIAKGEDGAPGSSGSRGLIGSSGARGDDGDDCSVTATGTDTDGNTTVTITCGTKATKLTIAKGEDGAPGSSGSRGAVGSSGAAGKDGDNCSIKDNEDGTATITCGTGSSASTYVVKDGAVGSSGSRGPVGSSGSRGAVGSSGARGEDGDDCSVKTNADGSATITCGTGSSASTHTVYNGSAGSAGGCTTTQGVGYVEITCVDGNSSSSTSKLIAAGYKACGDEVINTTTHFCYVDGTTKTVYAKCNGDEWNPTTQECKCTPVGDMSTCSVVDKSVLCAAVGESYNPATQICFDGNGNYDWEASEINPYPSAGVYSNTEYTACYALDGEHMCGIYRTEYSEYYTCSKDNVDVTKCTVLYET